MMAEDKAIKKAAQDSISRNNHTISSALQSSPAIFQQVVEKCAAQRIISPGEKNTYLDTCSTGQSLAYRTGLLVSNLRRTVGVVPNMLDDILCIFHESDSLNVQEAAKTIAKNYQFSLPKYRGLTCSQQQPSPPPPAVAYTGTRPSRQASQRSLTIRNLREVLNDLREGDFNDRSWHSLGVELGLHPRTLNNIKSDYSEAEECLRACISKWLSKADDVDVNGGANWSTLCNAIERISETGAHFIRDRHSIIPSQPVEQINYMYMYQGHSELSQIAGSDDGTQLRQRPYGSDDGTQLRQRPSQTALSHGALLYKSSQTKELFAHTTALHNKSSQTEKPDNPSIYIHFVRTGMLSLFLLTFLMTTTMITIILLQMRKQTYSLDHVEPGPQITDKLAGLSDVHIASKKLFLIQGDRPQLLNWERYGLRIGVSEGTLPSTETVEVAVVALVGGQFVFPENTILVSAVYAVFVSRPLLKPMRLEIQHCVDTADDPSVSNHLKFAIAPISQPGLPYHFSMVNGGKFNETKWYGSINRKEFCLVSIVGNKSIGGEEEEEEQKQKEEENKGGHHKKKGWQQQQEKVRNKYDEEKLDEERKIEQLELQKDVKEKALTTGVSESITYIAVLYYEVNDQANDEVTFTTAKKLNALIEHIEKYYAKAKKRQPINYRFGNSSEYIELILDHTPQEHSFTGWTIKPLVKPCRLYKEDIDEFGEDDAFPPSSMILVHGSPSFTTVPMLYYDVPLKGVLRPVTLCIDVSLRNIPSGYLSYTAAIGIYGLVLLGVIILILFGYFVFIKDSTPATVFYIAPATVFYGLVLGLIVSSLAEYFSMWTHIIRIFFGTFVVVVVINLLMTWRNGSDITKLQSLLASTIIGPIVVEIFKKL